MTAIQRWGTGTAGAAIVLWLAFAVMVVTTDPDDGANIGAGLLGLLGIAVSITAAVLLVVSARSAVARAAAVTSIALLAVFLFVAPGDGLADGVRIGLLVAAVATLAASACLVAVSRRGRLTG